MISKEDARLDACAVVFNWFNLLVGLAAVGGMWYCLIDTRLRVEDMQVTLGDMQDTLSALGQSINHYGTE